MVDLLGEEGGRVLLLAGAEVGVGPEALLLARQALPAGLGAALAVELLPLFPARGALRLGGAGHGTVDALHLRVELHRLGVAEARAQGEGVAELVRVAVVYARVGGAGQDAPGPGLVQLQGEADLEQLLPVLRRGLAAEPVGYVLPQGLGLLRPGGLPVYAQQPRFEPLRQPLAGAHGAQHVRKGAVERALLQKGDELRRAHAPAVYALQVAF